MITPAQIRAARAMVDITIEELSSESGVAPLVILQIESEEERYTTAGDIDLLKSALERRGVNFLANGEQGSGGAGLRMVSPYVEQGLRPEELTAANDD